jgi:hypothetical protein
MQLAMVREWGGSSERMAGQDPHAVRNAPSFAQARVEALMSSVTKTSSFSLWTRYAQHTRDQTAKYYP